jgi:hypothetical protein
MSDKIKKEEKSETIALTPAIATADKPNKTKGNICVDRS